MERTDRRSALRLALAAAIAPAVCSRTAIAATPDRLIAPPGMPMRYARRVVREIADGTHFSVSRSFTVRFEQFGGGFMMHGAQSAVEVDAPRGLSHFAELERARDESAIFPIALSPFGQILSQDIARLPGSDVARAVAEALEVFDNQPLAGDERAQLSAFVSALQGASQRVIALLPADLFAPADASRREEQRIALPGGGEGLVETSFAAERDLGTGLMRAARREVITVVGDSSRRNREEWSLAAI